MDFFVESCRLHKVRKPNKTTRVNFAPNIACCIDVDIYSNVWGAIHTDDKYKRKFDRFFTSCLKRLDTPELFPISLEDLECSEEKQLAFVIATQYYFGGGFFVETM